MGDPVVYELAVYSPSGRSEHPSLTAALAAARDRGGFVWVAMDAAPAPTEDLPPGLTGVARDLDLPELAVEDAVIAHQRPKLEIYDDVVFAVLRPARYVESGENVEVDEIAMFVGDGFVVTVRHGPTEVLARVRDELAAGSPLAAAGPACVVYRAADLVVDQQEDVIAELDADVDEIEEEVFGPDSDDHSQRIYRLKEEVAQFRRTVVPLARPLERLMVDPVPHVAAELTAYFRDVHDHVLRASDSIDVIDRQLTDALEANTARVSTVQNQIALQQNSDMRKISAWAAMALVPSMIAGIYGMNLQLWPNAQHVWGFPVVLGVMATACLLLYRAFRRNRWL